jgi:predicted RNA-binding protein with RPS1 domain
VDGEVKVGSRYQGKVLSIKEFGAIVELSDHPSGAMGAFPG